MFDAYLRPPALFNWSWDVARKQNGRYFGARPLRADRSCTNIDRICIFFKYYI